MAFALRLGRTRVEHALKNIDHKRLPSFRQFTLLPRVLTRLEKRTALSLFILCLISLSLLTWRWYDRATNIIPATGGEYSEGLIGQPTTTNPLLALKEIDRDLSYLTTRGLFRTNNNGEVVADLAANYNISDDHKTYKITLNDNLLWSDGVQLTADDVIFTFQTIKDKKILNSLAIGFKQVTITKQDDKNISFTLPEIYTPFLNTLTLGLIPAHIWQKIPMEQWATDEANLKPVGLGPWRFKTLNRDKDNTIRSYTLEPNPHSHTKAPYLQNVILRFYDDEQGAQEALQQGSIDGLGNIPTGGSAALSERKTGLYELTLPQYTAIFFNPSRTEILQQKNIRQALNYSLNRANLIKDTLNTKALPVAGPFVLGQLKQTINGRATAWDLNKASELLEKSGFAKVDKNTYYTKDNQPLEITLTAGDGDETLKTVEAIRQQWGLLGIKVNPDIVPNDKLQNDIIPTRNYQALLATEIIGFDLDPYPFWHSSQTAAPGLNLAGFQNHEADQLLIEARQTTDNNSRLAKYLELQNIFNEEVPAVFLYTTNYNYAMGRNIQNFNNTAIAEPAERFRNIEYWYINTKHQWNGK